MTEQILCPVHQVAAAGKHMRSDGTIEITCELCRRSRGPVGRRTLTQERLERLAGLGVRVGGRTGAGA